MNTPNPPPPRPADWPAPGPIDLTVHDLPHASSTMEWWYTNAHIVAADGRRLALFTSFFRMLRSYDEATERAEHIHFLTWALTDLDGEAYYQTSLVDPASPEIALERLEKSKTLKDPLLRRAAREIFERDAVPRPDVKLSRPARVSLERLELDYDGNTFTKVDDGRYALRLSSTDGKVGCDLVVTLQKPPVRHGDDGVVRGVSGEDMFYYYVPRCGLSGSVTLDGQTQPIASGSAWYDHEFGCPPPAAPDADPAPADAGDAEFTDRIAWNWVSVQLDDGWEISGYDLFDTEAEMSGVGRWLNLTAPDGARHQYKDFAFTPRATWTSTRTFNDYPVAWTLTVPGTGIELAVDAELVNQEFITTVSKPAFWEGRIRASGMRSGAPVAGIGFVERSGFMVAENLNEFFKAVSRMTQRSVDWFLPREPTEKHRIDLIGGADHPHYVDGVDGDQYARALIHPIRDIIDRGGKAWRSYMAVACCDVVGGDSTPHSRWLALPELLHVGSLIIDDVQDRSLTRRGGPTAHQRYGDAIAINAGNVAYFLGQLCVYGASISAEQKLRVYDIYFEALRAAHAGQALDIDGFASLMPHIVESGDGALIEARVLAVHRLKSAAPASALARIGAILGGGSAEQIRALDIYLERLGIAFQIMDDVLNLEGFEDDLKDCGEDLREGKVTFPVAKAMSLLDAAGRRELWDIVGSHPQERERIGRAIAIIDGCGGLSGSRQQAQDMVEEGWRILDAAVEDSFVKLVIRAFGWYVLERHY
jgi:geranylgeranyl pyrophosphate synthase/predicted secreted hydrolase